MRYMLILLWLLVANVANAIDCEKVPDCASLGYSTEDEPNCADGGYMYCPFNQEYKKCVQYDCEALGFTESDKTSWCSKLIKCKGNPRMTLCQNLCEIGDVYYADGTCGYAQDYDGSKTPVGVVYYVTDEGRHGKVINLHDLGRESESSAFNPADPYNSGNKYLIWGYYNYDVPKLTNYDPQKLDILTLMKNREPDLYNGKENTTKILSAEKPQCYYQEVKGISYYQNCMPQAAQAAHDFYPQNELKTDPKVGAGNWYFPSIGELMDLYGYDNSQITSYKDSLGATGAVKERVNSTLQVLKEKGSIAEPFSTESYYWSSTEESLTGAWIFSFGSGGRGYGSKHNTNGFVRVSLEF